jgi:hypothetical protein
MRVIMQSNKTRKASPRMWRLGLVLAAVVAAMAVFAGAYGLRPQPSSARLTPKVEVEPSAVSSIAGGGSTTIIVSTPNSNDCRRYQLDVTTGVRNDKGAVNCRGDRTGPGRVETLQVFPQPLTSD